MKMMKILPRLAGRAGRFLSLCSMLTLDRFLLVLCAVMGVMILGLVWGIVIEARQWRKKKDGKVGDLVQRPASFAHPADRSKRRT